MREDIGAMVADSGGVMTAVELADAMLAARGSVETSLDDRHQVASAVLRAAIALEGAMEEPRFQLFGDAQPRLIAKDEALVAPARMLGATADTLIGEEPLPSPERAAEVLRRASPELSEELGFTPARLLRLAAAVSERAALSSRLELYPRGLEPLKALRLSLGSLIGVRKLTVEKIQERVSGRYPDAAPLPGRPELDSVLEEAGAEREWQRATRTGRATTSRAAPAAAAGASRLSWVARSL